jgi:hypothetical protein
MFLNILIICIVIFVGLNFYSDLRNSMNTGHSFLENMEQKPIDTCLHGCLIPTSIHGNCGDLVRNGKDPNNWYKACPYKCITKKKNVNKQDYCQADKYLRVYGTKMEIVSPQNVIRRKIISILI